MTEVTIDTEVLGQRLPRVCVQCGEATETIRGAAFFWLSRWIWLCLLAGPAPFVFAAVWLGKRRTLLLPLCRFHGSPEYWRNCLLLFAVACQFTLLIFVPILLLEDEVAEMAGVGLFLVMVVLFLAAAAVHGGMIRAVGDISGPVRLRGVSPAFAAAAEAATEEAKERFDGPILKDLEQISRDRWKRSPPEDADPAPCREPPSDEDRYGSREA
jgi:hypothetical protein